MKKSTKILLLGGILLVLVGSITMLISGSILGGQKLKELAENGDLSITIDDVQRWSDFIQTGEVSEGGVKVVTKRGAIGKASDVKKLDIEFGAGTFEIQESQDDNIYLQMEHSISFKYGIDQEKTLYVKPVGNNIVKGTGEITLYLPKNMIFDEVELELGAGEFIANSLEMKELEVAVATGEVELKELKCGEAKMKVGAGALVVDRGEVKDISIDLAMGEAVLKLVGIEDDYDYDLSCGAGEVKVGSMSSAGLAFDKDTDFGREKHINVECAMGSVNIEFVQ